MIDGLFIVINIQALNFSRAYMKHKTYIAAFLLLVFGVYFNFIRPMPDLQKSIFGDDGDGLFTLWLLENVRLFFSHFDILQFINTNSYYPQNHLVLFWSDTFIFPGLLYTLFYSIFRNAVLSYNFVTFTAVSMAFVVHFFFFKTIMLWAKQKLIEQKLWIENSYQEIASSALLLLFTYSYTFCMTRMVYTVHFQNQWSFLTILGLLGMFKIFERSYKTGSILLTLSFTLLCFSSMYYAMLLGLLGGIFFVCAYFYLKINEFTKFFKQFLPYGLLTLCMTLPILYGYSLTEKNLSRSGGKATFDRIFLPLPGSLIYEFLLKLGIDLAKYHPFQHEVLLYAGVFLLLLAIPVFCYCIAQCAIFLKNDTRLKKFFYGILFLNVLSWLLPNSFVVFDFSVKAFLTTLALGAFFLFIFYCVLLAIQKRFLRPELAILFLSGIVIYGITFGRSIGFSNEFFNPSLYGLFSLFNPWMRALRAAGRFGVLATGMLSGITLYFVVLKGKLYKPLFALGLMVVLLAHTIEQKYHPYVNTYNIETILKPSEKESAFFSELQRSFLFFPVNPWHKNTYFQLLALPFKKLLLVNGYSGNSSSLFSKIRQISTGKDIPQAEDLELFKEEGIEVLVFSKSAYNLEKISHIKNSFPSPLFESENFLAYSI